MLRSTLVIVGLAMAATPVWAGPGGSRGRGGISIFGGPGQQGLFPSPFGNQGGLGQPLPGQGQRLPAQGQGQIPAQAQPSSPYQYQPAAQQTQRAATAAAPPSTAVPTNDIPYKGPGVTLVNPKETEGTVKYTIDGHVYQMTAGQTQNLKTKANWVIEFDRGGAFGTARYTLEEGRFEFVVTKRGWDVHRSADPPAATTAAPPTNAIPGQDTTTAKK
jgi:hypothetical protein